MVRSRLESLGYELCRSWKGPGYERLRPWLESPGYELGINPV
jgi:hypothetical protein